jgi:hypothetical protein
MGMGMGMGVRVLAVCLDTGIPLGTWLCIPRRRLRPLAAKQTDKVFPSPLPAGWLCNTRPALHVTVT